MLETIRFFSFKGNQVEVCKSKGGETNWVHITDVKYILPVDNVIRNIPEYHNFGRKTTLRLNPEKIPDLQWNVATTLNTTPMLTMQKSNIDTDINLLDMVSLRMTTHLTVNNIT